MGFKKTVDAEALIEDPSKSIADGVFGSLFGNSNYYPQIFAAVCKHFKVSADTPWEDLPPRVRRAFLDGMGDTKISVDYQKLDGRRSQWDTKFSGVRNILYELSLIHISSAERRNDSQRRAVPSGRYGKPRFPYLSVDLFRLG